MEKTESNEKEKILLTYILKHQQDKNLTSIIDILNKNSFWEIFPPKDVEILSWNVLIGLGHVVVLRFSASRLREVNLSLEKGAWGAFNTEAYSTYDYTDALEEKKIKINNTI
jgi:hypothetical protein